MSSLPAAFYETKGSPVKIPFVLVTVAVTNVGRIIQKPNSPVAAAAPFILHFKPAGERMFGARGPASIKTAGDRQGRGNPPKQLGMAFGS
jgi:hypothetical protein